MKRAVITLEDDITDDGEECVDIKINFGDDGADHTSLAHQYALIMAKAAMKADEDG